MIEHAIHTVAAAAWTRFNKWRVEMEIIGETKRVFWLSAAQYDFLTSAFEHTPKGYSNNHVVVIGEFDEQGHYVRCRAVALPPPRRHYTPLTTIMEIEDALRDHD